MRRSPLTLAVPRCSRGPTAPTRLWAFEGRGDPGEAKWEQVGGPGIQWFEHKSANPGVGLCPATGCVTLGRRLHLAGASMAFQPVERGVYCPCSFLPGVLAKCGAHVGSAAASTGGVIVSF
jgi:hypothetical protein